MTRSGAGLLGRLAFCAVAAALVILSIGRPIWTMKLEAPQYPKGLELRAYGQYLEGDIREINILNQYIGMKDLSARPAPEMRLFPVALGVLLLLLLVAPLNRAFYGAATLLLLLFPIAVLGDMQHWLYRYGHALDPDAPLRQEPFTPLVLGISRIGQFESTARLAGGLGLIIAAGVILLVGYFVMRLFRKQFWADVSMARPITAASILLLSGAALPGATLQARIDAAPPRSTVTVERGLYNERLIIRKPLALIAPHGAVIDGGGIGSVITIDTDGVEVRGFTIRNSGRKTTEEAAGIDVRGSNHRIAGNIVTDVHFGIHMTEGHGSVVANNVIRPGRGGGYRAGDGINLWYVKNSLLTGNRVSAARDGIYLSFTDGVIVRQNQITRSRYGIHSMFSENVTVEQNLSRENLLGAALMNSNRLSFRGNRIERNRTGATAYGILLKDIGELVLENNEIIRNRIGIYADNAPDRQDRTAVVRRNLFLGNGTAFALQSNVRLTVTGNDVIDNLCEVRNEGAMLSSISWSHQGVGNYWSDYRGYDKDADGVGETPFTVAGVLDYLLQKNPLARTFVHTPAHRALDVAARMFPLFRTDPLLIDPHPLMRPQRHQQGKES